MVDSENLRDLLSKTLLLESSSECCWSRSQLVRANLSTSSFNISFLLSQKENMEGKGKKKREKQKRGKGRGRIAAKRGNKQKSKGSEKIGTHFEPTTLAVS